ncbi:uncharacterized protein LOC116430683 [Nomia melanderi]|uniref:uncharacterized protein LOC116430683 n=1 Tax=Nomia melanderi TaxID=2448451 RepID=UPI0013041FDF|nr:laccase-5-like [Nomia melanderi]XP_031841015.1 laccase-5-like [Nomia melanderi]
MASLQPAALSGHFLNPWKLFVLLVIVSTSLKLTHCQGNSYSSSWSSASASASASSASASSSSSSSSWAWPSSSSSSSFNESSLLSTPEECKRECVLGEEPKICYYKFFIEFYTVLGPACDKKEQWKECIWADGVEKTMTSINRQFPGPAIEVCQNDQIVVDITNAASGTEVTMHWHGLFQNGYQYYDGVPYVTQCPIPSSSTFRYDFNAGNAGTHFYHSHVMMYMMDGQEGPLIIRDPDDPHADLYDVDDTVIFLSDWMHHLSLERFPGFYRKDLGQAAQNILINGRGNWTDPETKKTTNAKLTVFPVKPKLRYRIRIINSFSTVCPSELIIHEHRSTLIAQDGANVKPKVVDSLVLSTGERADVIIETNQKVDSYWIQVRGLNECADKKVQQFAILQYEGAPATPSTPQPSYDYVVSGVVYNSLDASKCNTKDTKTVVCANQLESVKEVDPDLLKVVPDVRHVMNFWFFNYTQYGNRLLFNSGPTYRAFFDVNDRSQLISTFNNITYETPASPLLTDSRSYETICRQNAPNTCTQPCTCTQVLRVNRGAVAEILIYDSNPLDGLDHPFHLHGYEFSVLSIQSIVTGTTNITAMDVNTILSEHTKRLQRGEYKNPPGKDTVKIPRGGYAIIRFRANNPGYWLIHCHFSWHHATGMELVIQVGDHSDLPPIPPEFPTCSNWKPPLQTLQDFYGFSFPNN